MSKDRREFVLLSVDLPDHPKLASLDDPAAGWLYVTAMCYCGRNLTDGVFPLRMVLRIAGVEKDKAEALAEVGLWHLPGHECARCQQPGPGEVVVHDYLQHQRSRAEAEAMRAKKSAAGAMGAAKRWAGKSNGSPIAGAMAPAMANGWQSDSKPMAEVEGEVEVPTDVATYAAQKRGKRIPDDFAVTERMVAWARENAPDVDGRTETANFIDYWRSKPGKDATKLDWERTWHTWMRNAQQRAPRRAPGSAVRNGHQPYQDPDRSEYSKLRKASR